MPVDSDSGMPLKGYLSYIENSLEAKQAYCKDIIQCVALDENIDIICADNGKLLGYPPNRIWIDIDDDGTIQVVDLFVGNILAVCHEGDEFVSIHDEDVEVIRRHLAPVVQTNTGLMPISESLLMKVDVHDED